VDSVASAYALAGLRSKTGVKNAVPLCPGMMPARAAWAFRHFGAEPPACRADVYVRVGDLVSTDVPSIGAGETLYAALKTLDRSGEAELPVTDHSGVFIGMLNPAALLSQFLALTGEGKGMSLAGRTVYSSETMIRELLHAEALAGGCDPRLRKFNVYVAAMCAETFSARMDSLPGAGAEAETAIVVGDRPDIHRLVVERRLPLLIITGASPQIDSALLEDAAAAGVTILATRYDSAKATRLLKFSTPAGAAPLEKDCIALQAGDRVQDVRASLQSSPDNIFPVLDTEGRLAGVVRKDAFSAPPPFRMILVDHNEPEQGIPGIEDIPVTEVVDHHRIAMRPTADPIKYTADAVGSTCTLVEGLYRAAGIAPSREAAGIMLAGIVADTLLFQSPTTTEIDRAAAARLSGICGESPDAIMKGLLSAASPLSSMTPSGAVDSDRKTYSGSGYRFSLSQLEESNFEVFHSQRAEITAAIDNLAEREKLDFAGLLVTDPVRGDSEFLYRGAESVRRVLPWRRRGDGLFILPGVLSRKKQLLPQILAALSSLAK